MIQGIKYYKGFKYQLAEDYTLTIPITGFNVNIEFIQLLLQGTLLIRAGYAWDGPSGPTWDTPNFMRGSLVHDALYELMRKQLLPQAYRREADKLLRDICLVDGMSRVRAKYVFWAVRTFAADSAAVKARREVITAGGSQ